MVKEVMRALNKSEPRVLAIPSVVLGWLLLIRAHRATVGSPVALADR